MKKKVFYFVKNVTIVTGIVLVWRGIWYVLDTVDDTFFNGNHSWTAVVGIIIGLCILYIPDKDLKEIQKI